MKTIILILSFIFISIIAYCDFDLNSEILSHVTSNGVSTIHKISKDKLKELPQWDPEKNENLPCSHSDAIKTGKEWLKKKYPKMDDYEIREIQIKKMGYQSKENNWFFCITYRPIIGDQVMYGTEYKVVVLLNKEIVEPLITKN